MIAEPPVLVGAVHVNVACPTPNVCEEIPGEEGTDWAVLDTATAVAVVRGVAASLAWTTAE